MLKVVAVLIVLPTVVAIIRTLVEKRSTALFISLAIEAIALVITLFCAVVLWSYAEELVDPPSDDTMVVYVAPGYGYHQYQPSADPEDPTAPSQSPGYPVQQHYPQQPYPQWPYPQQPYPQQPYPQQPYQQQGYNWWGPQHHYPSPQTHPAYYPPQPGPPPPNL